MNTTKIKSLEKKMLFVTKQANAYRLSRNKSKTAKEHRAWQTLIDLCEADKIDLKKEIAVLKGKGLKAPATRGLRKLCARNFNVTGLRKKNGTTKKGYITKKGGKIVKVATTKK